jgi:hypothetical protein
MGRLTADFSRLVESIRTGRMERCTLNQANSFKTAERKRTVNGMLAGFRTAQAEMARRQRRFLHEFTTGIEQSVGAIRKGLRTDLDGARAMWFGRALSAPPVREHSKRATKAASA